MISLRQARFSPTAAWLVASILMLGIAPASAQSDRITGPIDHYRTVPLTGHLQPLARAEFDRGAVAPDFARCVDIHRKPGYDPVELFLDPKIPMPKLKIARRLFQKKLGFRMLMDVIPLDATLVKGSHGRRPADKKDWPVIITEKPGLLGAEPIESTDVFQILLRRCDAGQNA